MAWQHAVKLILFSLSAGIANAQSRQEALPPSGVAVVTGAELQREVTSNTLTGRLTSGGRDYFSEYHSPDGRIYGHNNDVPVRDGCWVVRGDEICFTYEKGPNPGVFCWEYFRAQSGYVIRRQLSGSVGVAKLEAGNPYKWNDGGEPWSCEALQSWRQQYTPRDLVKRYAARQVRRPDKLDAFEASANR